MLKYRLITGPVLILVLLGVVWFDGWLDSVAISGGWSAFFRGKDHLPRGLAILGLGLIFMPLAALELTAIIRATGIMARGWLTGLAAGLGLFLCYAIPMETEAIEAVAMVATGLLVVFVMSLLAFSRGRNTEGVLAASGAVVFAMVYLGLAFGFLLALRREHSGWWIVGVVMVTKSCDIGAYFTGRAIGKHKLIPWLSPGKTWEGLVGGVVVAALVGWGLATASARLPEVTDHLLPGVGIFCGVMFGLVGQFGDLTMSMFKRGSGLKDSSALLPGMGGVLDVLDSPLMVAPVAYWILTLSAG